MQFTTLFSITASIALANAGLLKSRQADDLLAKLNVYDYVTGVDSCNGEDDTPVYIEVGPKVADQCIPFSEEYPTVQVLSLQQGYEVTFFTDNCTAGTDPLVLPYSGACENSETGKPFLSYKVTESTE